MITYFENMLSSLQSCINKEVYFFIGINLLS